MTSEEAEFSGQEIMRQLEQRRADQRKDWNRNVFRVRTNDDLAVKSKIIVSRTISL